MKAREALFPKMFVKTTPPDQIEKALESSLKLTGGQTIDLNIDPNTGAPWFAPPSLASVKRMSRSGHPATSKAAAAALVASGGQEKAKTKVYAGLQMLGGAGITSAELAAGAGIAHPTVHKRLPDLRRDGLVVNGPIRTCSVTGRKSLTWRAA